MNAIEGQRGIVLVVFDGVKLLDAVGPAEVFAEANRFGAGYCLSFVSVDGEDVTTTVGTKIAVIRSVRPSSGRTRCLVAGGGHPGGPADRPAPRRSRRSGAGTHPTVGIDLHGSVHPGPGRYPERSPSDWAWRHTRLLAKAFPDIRVEPDAIFVQDGNVFTSAGVSAGIDLALALVEMD